jgi:hypothetical protein
MCSVACGLSTMSSTPAILALGSGLSEPQGMAEESPKAWLRTQAGTCSIPPSKRCLDSRTRRGFEQAFVTRMLIGCGGNDA